MTRQTSHLYAIPNFINGMGQVLDMGNTQEIYNESQTPVEADGKALRNDWEAVGNDILNSMTEYGEKQA